MAILEPNDFDKMNDPEWAKLQRKADKLKRMRVKIAQDEEAKSQFGIPTSLELEQQFYGKEGQTEGQGSSDISPTKQ